VHTPLNLKDGLCILGPEKYLKILLTVLFSGIMVPEIFFKESFKNPRPKHSYIGNVK
jgi:hypothetical protein